ncbi:MAG: hypothetical protein KatS3mg114_0983 [Planctomycetaceae bacterium]|nr:MAG: hypothetical protein KatS3mg114_0983 [Planctomycetaceae bacterium]
MLNGLQYRQLSISVNPGNSGGPALNPQGEVVGVVTMKAREQEGMAFCVPASAVYEALEEMRHLSPRKRRELESEHRLLVVFRSLRTIGEIYKLGLIAYVDAMRRANEQGQNVNLGLAQAQQELHDKLQACDALLMGDLNSLVPVILVDQYLSMTSRNHLRELWKNYLELKNCVEQPRGTFLSYTIKCKQLIDTHDQAVHALQQVLKIEEN